MDLSHILDSINLLVGETVIVHFREADGIDALGNIVWVDVPTEVDNVLVSQMSNYSVDEDIRPEGERGDWTLHFPKTFDRDLQHLVIDVRGVPCSVVGVPVHYIEENTPGDWWLKVDVEVIDG